MERMIDALAEWPQQLRMGIDALGSLDVRWRQPIVGTTSAVLMCGMGASGVVGRIMAALLAARCPVPCLLLDTPDLPAWVGRSSRIILVSYSGNTWETLALAQQLDARAVSYMTMTGGGELSRMSSLEAQIVVPRFVAPRAALGFFLGAMRSLFDQWFSGCFTLSPEDWIAHAGRCVDRYCRPNAFEEFLAHTHDASHVWTWGVAPVMAAAAYRLQTQLNENSKIFAAAQHITELCHNVVEGLPSASQERVILLAPTLLSRLVSHALDALESIAQRYALPLYKPAFLGDTLEEQLISALIWSDYASCYLGEARGVTIEAVPVIDQIKQYPLSA